MKYTRYVVYAAITAALYFVMVVGLAPVSFHILQFRAANVLKALSVCHPAFAFGFGLGNFFANQASPFGVLDWGIMPVFYIGAALIAWTLRKRRWLAVGAQSAVIAVGVATFPLGLGAGLPWLASFVSVFASTVVIIGAGTLILVPAWEAVNRNET